MFPVYLADHEIYNSFFFAELIYWGVTIHGCLQYIILKIKDILKSL